MDKQTVRQIVLLSMVFFFATLSLLVNYLFGKMQFAEWFYHILNRIIEAVVIGLILSMVGKLPSEIVEE